MVLRRRDRNNRRARRGVVLAEAAVVYPAFILLLMGVTVLGLGLFRRHQLGHLAGEAARWASVRGESYQQEQQQPPPSEEDVRAFVLQRASALDPDALTVDLSLTPDRATVILHYTWIPEALVPPVEFEVEASAPVTY